MKPRALGAIMVVSLGCLFMPFGAAEAQSTLDRVKSRGTLVVATDPGWPPASWRNDQGEFEGFDVDVSKELARRLGVAAEFYMPYVFQDVLAGNWGGKWDIATSLTPTVQRSEKVQFAAVYYYGPSSLAVHRDNTAIQEPSEASGKRIGVVQGTEYEKYLTREPFDVFDMPAFTYKIDQPTIVILPDQDAVYAALAKGNGAEVDGIIDATDALVRRIGNGAPFRIVGQPLTYTPSAIAVDRDEDALAAAVREIIDAMHKDGTLARLSMKWFDYDLTQY